MRNFNLQRWLDGRREQYVLLETSELDDFDDLEDVELGGFGFPHYSEIDNPSSNHYLLL